MRCSLRHRWAAPPPKAAEQLRSGQMSRGGQVLVGREEGRIFTGSKEEMDASVIIPLPLGETPGGMNVPSQLAGMVAN